VFDSISAAGEVAAGWPLSTTGGMDATPARRLVSSLAPRML
jgi:hypothetical protein